MDPHTPLADHIDKPPRNAKFCGDSGGRSRAFPRRNNIFGFQFGAAVPLALGKLIKAFSVRNIVRPASPREVFSGVVRLVAVAVKNLRSGKRATECRRDQPVDILIGFLSVSRELYHRISATVSERRENSLCNVSPARLPVRYPASNGSNASAIADFVSTFVSLYREPLFHGWNIMCGVRRFKFSWKQYP